jgi:glycerol-3-phosphate dehydrogenase
MPALCRAGGKWTTYRLMAEDAIDKALASGRLRAAGPCRTRELPLVGAKGFTPALFTDVAQHYKVPHRPGAIDTSVARYLAGVLVAPGPLQQPCCLLGLV